MMQNCVFPDGNTLSISSGTYMTFSTSQDPGTYSFTIDAISATGLTKSYIIEYRVLSSEPDCPDILEGLFDVSQDCTGTAQDGDYTTLIEADGFNDRITIENLYFNNVNLQVDVDCNTNDLDMPSQIVSNNEFIGSGSFNPNTGRIVLNYRRYFFQNGQLVFDECDVIMTNQ